MGRRILKDRDNALGSMIKVKKELDRWLGNPQDADEAERDDCAEKNRC